MSWTAGEAGSPPPAFYNYQRAGQARPMTLVEVPLQPQTQPAVQRSDPQPIQPAKQSVNITQSNLDPTSRPFTPASFQSHSSNSYETPSAPVTRSRPRTSWIMFSYFGKKSQQHSDTFSEETLSTSSISRPESSFMSQQGSFFADDPLPEDLKFLLPELDNTKEEDLKDFFPRKKRLPAHVLPDISSAILPHYCPICLPLEWKVSPTPLANTEELPSLRSKTSGPPNIRGGLHTHNTPYP
eukprot:TRINITY_DN23168_c0_g1_i1.p1 TRINITY_DN23168_c0_g1~~TRINITY_DN23168_c0_g1_i1.p1  ORF type:complete len:261 (+),score=38.09 TRINITY_DN23168_c0_g1_i1:64-783(+)